MPDNVDKSKAKAEFKDGMLTLTRPKSEKAKPRALEVKMPRIARTQKWQSGMRWIDTFGFAALLAVAALPLSQTPVLMVCALMNMPMTEILLSVFAVNASFEACCRGR